MAVRVRPRATARTAMFTGFAVKEDALQVECRHLGAIVGFQLHFNTLEKADADRQVRALAGRRECSTPSPNAISA